MTTLYLDPKGVASLLEVLSGRVTDGMTIRSLCPSCQSDPDEQPLLTLRQDGMRTIPVCSAGCSVGDICRAAGVDPVLEARPTTVEGMLADLHPELASDLDKALLPIWPMIYATPPLAQTKALEQVAERVKLKPAEIRKAYRAWCKEHNAKERAKDVRTAVRTVGPEEEPPEWLGEAPTAAEGPQREARPNELEPLVRASHPALARALISDLQAGQEAPVVFDEGELWRYRNGSGWTCVPEHELWRLLDSYDGRPYIAGVLQNGSPMLRPLSLKAGDAAAALKWAKHIVTRPEFFLDASPGIAFRNLDVTADADGIQTKPQDWRARRRYVLPYDYSDTVECPRWSQFLAEVLALDPHGTTTVLSLQEFLGAALTGIATRFARCLVLVGVGANGKSVMLEVFSAMFPKALRSALSPQDFQRTFRLAELAGKRLNVHNELPSSDVVASDTFKEVTAGNEATAERKGRDPFTFKPIAAHAFACNLLPVSMDTSDGYIRRFILVPLDRRFDEREQDKGLADHLIQHELPAIARWGLEGAVRLLQQGHYTISPTSLATMEEWRQDSDKVRAWHAERCVQSGSTAGQVLYDDYRDWAEKTGHERMSATTFFRRLKAMGIPCRRTNKARTYPVTLAGRAIPQEAWT